MTYGKMISVIVPVYNEADNVCLLHQELTGMFVGLARYDYELIWVNDGSSDESYGTLNALVADDHHSTLIDFARNFGKEIAITAGLHQAKGDAALMIDADLQHPVAMIPEFLERWEGGAEVVIGVRNRTHGLHILERFRSWMFYRMLNLITETKLVPRATDFRLIDREVIDAFNRFTERQRIARGLIDWLGFRRDFIYFDAAERLSGKASYSLMKLFHLAVDSFVSLSLFPLKLAGYLGMLITVSAGILGTFIFAQKYLLHDAGGYSFSGPAILAVIILFLVGIMLICLGLIALYIANIHGEVINRPIYVKRQSSRRVGL
jgi:Glycosyltransferases involved in cell wall biogenesis